MSGVRPTTVVGASLHAKVQIQAPNPNPNPYPNPNPKAPQDYRSDVRGLLAVVETDLPVLDD